MLQRHTCLFALHGGHRQMYCSRLVLRHLQCSSEFFVEFEQTEGSGEPDVHMLQRHPCFFPLRGGRREIQGVLALGPIRGGWASRNSGWWGDGSGLVRGAQPVFEGAGRAGRPTVSFRPTDRGELFVGADRGRGQTEGSGDPDVLPRHTCVFALHGGHRQMHCSRLVFFSPGVC